jgi:hypothetical protein
LCICLASCTVADGLKRGVGHPQQGPVSRQHGVVKGARLIGKSLKLNDQDLSIVKG